MHLHIQKLEFPYQREVQLFFITFSRAFDLHGAIRKAVLENNSTFDGDYIDCLMAVQNVPEELCSKHGFLLVRDMTYSYLRIQEDV